MSINDVQNELNSIKTSSSMADKINNNIESDKDNINSILKKNIRNLESFVEGKVINMYARPWNKLEPKLKRHKINEFLQEMLNEKKINLINFNKLVHQINKEIEFNRKINLTYDKEACVITDFDFSTYLSI